MAQVYRSDVSVAYAIKNSHRVVGGIDPSPTASILQTVITQTVAMTTELSPSLPGVLSYAKKLKSVLDLDVSVALVRDRVFSATLSAVQQVRKSITLTSTINVPRKIVHKALYKAYQEVTDNVAFGKAKMTGFVFDVMSKNQSLHSLSTILGSSEDPLELLKVLT